MRESMSIEDILNHFNWVKVDGRELNQQEQIILSMQITELIHVNQEILPASSKVNRYPFYIFLGGNIPSDFRTINGYKPKTMIFYKNYCELEILRIAYQLGLYNEDLLCIYETTKKRIKNNCFGRFCPTGECYETSIAVFRFLSTVFADETDWIEMYMRNITDTILLDQKKISYQTKLYFLQTLCEMNTDTSFQYLSKLSLQIQQLTERLPKISSAYRTINMQMISNCHHTFFLHGHTMSGGDSMLKQYKNTSNLYDDGNIPDVDIDPYKKNKSEQNPLASSYHKGEKEPLPESTRVRRDGPGGD